jgi:hypothetical protein
MRAMGSRRRREGRCILLAAAALLTSAAIAEGPTTAPAERAATGLRWRLDSERLAPSVSVELEALTTFANAVGRDGELSDHVLFEQLNDQVQSGAKSVTRKAVRNYLLGAMGLDRGIDRVRDGMGGNSGGAVDFRFGVHSAEPEVGLRYRMHSGALRLQLRLDGMVGINFRLADVERSEIGVVYDGHDEFVIRARLGF